MQNLNYIMFRCYTFNSRWHDPTKWHGYNSPISLWLLDQSRRPSSSPARSQSQSRIPVSHEKQSENYSEKSVRLQCYGSLSERSQHSSCCRPNIELASNEPCTAARSICTLLHISHLKDRVSKILDSFAVGIEYLGELCGITNTLQQRRFSCVRSANNENPEPTNTVKVLLDLSRIQTEILFDTRRDDWIYMMCIFSPCRDGGASCGAYMVCLFSQRDGWGLCRIYGVMSFFGPKGLYRIHMWLSSRSKETSVTRSGRCLSSSFEECAGLFRLARPEDNSASTIPSISAITYLFSYMAKPTRIC